MRTLRQYEKELTSFLNRLLDIDIEAYVLVPHEHADIDAIASLRLFSEVLGKIRSSANIHTLLPGVSSSARKLLNGLGIEIPEFHTVKPDVNYVSVLLDISDPYRFISPNIRDIVMSSHSIFAIDHHKTGAPRGVYVLYLPFSSTTEIILYIADHLGVLDDIISNEKMSTLAAAGIISDTAFFSTTSIATFYYMDKLYTHINYEQIAELFRRQRTRELSERMAIIKALQRTMVRKVDDKIIVVTHVGSYESIVANTILQLGADIVFVISKKKERGKHFYRVIARSRRGKLTDILSRICNRLGGTYGAIADKVGGMQLSAKIKLDKLKKIIMEEILSYTYPRNHTLTIQD